MRYGHHETHHGLWTGRGQVQRAFLCSCLSALCSSQVSPSLPSAAAVRQRPLNAAIGNRRHRGRREAGYNETCTACHGKDGTGGELGPPVARAESPLSAPARIRKSSTRSRTGSRARRCRRSARQFSDDNIWKVTVHIHGSSRHRGSTHLRKETRRRGEAIFWTGAKCGGCHMVKGRGNVPGPDLSNLGGTRKVQNIVDALTKRQSQDRRGRRHARRDDCGEYEATSRCVSPPRTESVVSGILKNEDSFSLQVLGKRRPEPMPVQARGREGVLRPTESDAARLGQALEPGGVSESSGVPDEAMHAASRLRRRRAAAVLP